MTNAIKKFIARPSRYIIGEDDDSDILFSNENGTHRGEGVNISSTGLAFIVYSSSAPKLSDVIRLEFSVPNYKKLSWWGRVVRLSEYSENKWWKKTQTTESLVLVAVHFHDIPEGQKVQIEEALRNKFKLIQRKKRQAQIAYALNFIKSHSKSILIYGSLILISFVFLWLLSQPFGNYDKDRGSPWGQRFKSFLKNN